MRFKMVLASALWATLGALGIQSAAGIWDNHHAIGEAAAFREAEDHNLKAAKERANRQRAVEVPPTPLPNALPLLGKEGTDSDGYPLRYVDGPALRSLLSHKQFATLTEYFEKFQSEFEANPRCERWPRDAADAVGTGEPALLNNLDAWCEATPKSFAPYLVRGTYWRAAAWHARGTNYAAETAARNMELMREAATKAVADLERALARRPKLVAALDEEILALQLHGTDSEREEALNRAILICPTCLLPRLAFIHTLTPRWGGSYEQMETFATTRANRLNPRMKMLPGLIDLDRAQVLENRNDFDQALAAINRACELGEYWEFLEERADIKLWKDDLEGALVDINRAIALRPGVVNLVFKRARILYHQKSYEKAAQDLLVGVKANPTDQLAKRIMPRVAQGLSYEGWQHYKAGRREEAIRLYELAGELDPINSEIQHRYSIILGKNGAGEVPAIADLEARVKASPNDFRAVQQLDYTLSREGQYEKILGLWNEFLSRHPDHKLALLERVGTLMHLKRYNEAMADAKRACELGVTRACSDAKRLAAYTR